ncbi:MAG: zf-HC2 domain-containing protein [Candidatus Pristimantibacillus sp.]
MSNSSQSGKYEIEADLSVTVHIETSMMERYVTDQLSEQDREQVETHMATCDPCIERFMTAMAAVEASGSSEGCEAARLSIPLIELPDMERLGRRVSEKLFAEQGQSSDTPIAVVVQERPLRRRSWLQHPATHFTAAAAITLLLLGTGTFNGISERLTEIEQERLTENQPEQSLVTPNQQGPSWSDRMVDRTTSWINEMQNNRFK